MAIDDDEGNEESGSLEGQRMWCSMFEGDDAPGLWPGPGPEAAALGPIKLFASTVVKSSTVATGSRVLGPPGRSNECSIRCANEYGDRLSCSSAQLEKRVQVAARRRTLS